MTKLIISILILFSLYSYSSFPLLESARENFYKATEEEEAVDKAISQFQQIKKIEPDLNGLAEVYIGSLTALKATYTYWPNKKMEWAKKGIAIMDEGLAKDPNNIESLFIYGTTCYYLPFFFEKGKDAENSLLKILDLLEAGRTIPEKELLKNAIQFIIDNIEPKGEKLKQAKKFLKQLQIKD